MGASANGPSVLAIASPAKTISPLRGCYGAEGNQQNVRSLGRLAAVSSPAAAGAGFDDDFLATGLADTRGVPLAGRQRETFLLRAAGYRDLAHGRLYEGHVNALQLIARVGTAEQRRLAARDVAAGRLFGVWNTEAADGVRVVRGDGAASHLSGRKTFCSGAGRVGRAIVTGLLQSGPTQMFVLDTSALGGRIDRSFWQPFGMQASDSFAVTFDGMVANEIETLGGPGAYAASPWFEAGAARFVAVQSGGVERLADELAVWLRAGARHDDPLAVANLGACSIAAATTRLWAERCAAQWQAFDDGAIASANLCATVDGARVAVERAALDVAEAVERGAGARGLLEPAPFSRLVSDLRMYLRQPAPDQALMRAGRAALASNVRA